MAVYNTGHEKFRTTKIVFTFTGAAGAGANGNFSIDKNPIPYLNQGEFIYEVFYRVTTTLTSGDTAGTYLQLGLTVDDVDCIFDATTGIVDTLNTNALGIKTAPVAYTKSLIDGREIVADIGGTNDITGGVLEVIITIARADEIPDSGVIEQEFNS